MKQNIILLKQKVDELVENKSKEYVEVFFDFISETKKFFKKQSLFYLAQLKEYPELKKWADDDFLKKIIPLLAKIYLLWGKEEVERLNNNLLQYWYADMLDDNISVSSKEAYKYAEKRAWELISWINETTANQISDIISRAIKDKTPINEIATKIENQFVNYSLFRSTLISQQELAMAYNEASKEQMKNFAKNLNVEWRKRAITQKDNQVRPSHRENELEGRIPRSQVFSWTGSDTAPFWFFCRCDVIYSLVNPDTGKLYEDNDVTYWGWYTDEQVENFNKIFWEIEDYNFKISKKERKFINSKKINDKELLTLKMYSNELFTIFNDFFKKWKKTKEFNSSIKFMFWWFRKLDNFSGVSYRWHKVSDDSELEKILNLKPWDIYKTNSFFSSSKSKIKSIDFTDKNSIIFKIISKKWKDFEKISTKKSEKEVLFLPNTLFKVESIKNDWKFTIIEVTDLNL